MLKFLLTLAALLFLGPFLLAALALLPLLCLVLLPLCLLGLGFGLLLAVVGAIVTLPFKLLGCLCTV